MKNSERGESRTGGGDLSPPTRSSPRKPARLGLDLSEDRHLSARDTVGDGVPGTQGQHRGQAVGRTSRHTTAVTSTNAVARTGATPTITPQ